MYSPKINAPHSSFPLEATKRTGDDFTRSQSNGTTPVHSPTGYASPPQKVSISPTQTEAAIANQRTRTREDQRYRVSAKPMNSYPNAVPTHRPENSRLNSQSANDVSDENEMIENLTRTFSDPLPAPVRHAKLPNGNHIKVVPPPPEDLRFTPQKIPHSQSVSQISSGARKIEVYPTRALSDPEITPMVFPQVLRKPGSFAKPPLVSKPVVPAKPSVPPKPRTSPKPSVASTRVKSPVFSDTDNSHHNEPIKSKVASTPSRINRDSIGKREMSGDKYVHEGMHDDNDEVFVEPSQDENKSPDSYPGPVRKRRSSLPKDGMTSSTEKGRVQSKPRPKTMLLPQNLQDEGVFTVQVRCVGIYKLVHVLILLSN
jgi:hypothetical protein